MGTPFMVRAVNGELVVTPGSGIDRSIGQQEFMTVVPFILRGDPRTRWKHLTNNVSYLDAIVEDLREVVIEQAVANVPYVLPKINVDPITFGLQAQRILDLENEVGHLKTRLEAGNGRGSTSAMELRRLERAEGRARELEAALREGDHDRSRIEAQLRAELASANGSRKIAGEAMRRAERDMALLRSELAIALAPQELPKARATQQRDLEQSRIERDLARRDVNEALARVRELEKEVAKLGGTSAGAEAALPFVVQLSLGSMRFPRDFSSNPEIAKRLHAAAAVIFSNPVAAVDETRRALEAAARSIYRSSFGNDGPRPFHELAAELRGNALLPDGDWHLMKNLWSRASGGCCDQRLTIESVAVPRKGRGQRNPASGSE